MSEDNKKIVHADSVGKTFTMPEIYDIAFDFRDVGKEVDFLLQMALMHSGKSVASAMELACGPAYHTRELARRSLISDGLDLEPKMVSYTRGLIEKECSSARIFEGDMRSFVPEQKYDLVYCLMASFAHLQTNDDIVEHFNCAADMLTDGGIYVISTAHPRDFYGDEDPSAETNWEMTRGDITVKTSWGGLEQKFDPLTEIDDLLVSYEVTTPTETTRYEFPDRYRRCSYQLFDALVKLSGRFEIVDMYGDFNTNISLSNDRACWRFIPILRKIK
ncbi:MAG: class I SAM-dependent methyltransferase [candidate division Zixibacteria bacterium]|nr:class I SAM-dependent methyltransferase [candidate division Zixibacteria bacterium]